MFLFLAFIKTISPLSPTHVTSLPGYKSVVKKRLTGVKNGKKLKKTPFLLHITRKTPIFGSILST